MKDIVNKFSKKVILPILISVLMGTVCGHVVYSIYNKGNKLIFSNNIVYLLQTGAYSNYNNMRTNSLSHNYAYYEDAGMYKTVIGITHDKDNIDKIKSAYGNDIVVSKYIIKDLDLLNKIKNFDLQLEKENDSKKINELVLTMLKLYDTENNVKLTKLE